MSDVEEKYTSRYALLEKPEFRPTIPQHMLAKLTDSEKYIVTTVNLWEQQYAWLLEHTLANNHAVVELDLWRQTFDRWKTTVTSKWAVLAIAGAVIAPAFLFALFEWLFGFFKH